MRQPLRTRAQVSPAERRPRPRRSPGAGTRARFDGRGECFIETGDGKAGFGGGDFYAEPKPIVRLRKPGRRWHLGKIWFEKSWLYTQL